MRNKKGFIFVEAIIVLSVVSLSLAISLGTYTLIASRSKIKEYYNQSGDIYLLYSISKLGTTASNNYVTLSQNASNSFWTNKSSCSSSKMGTFVTNCADIFTNYEMQNFGLLVNLQTDIENNTKNFDNGTIDFLNTLKKYHDAGKTKPIKYLVARFYRDNDYYYAAIEIEEEA